MDVSKKRKRDVDCPRITYDATTKVFDRLFKEESLEEMKNVVRKKFGLSPSLAVHLTQLRDGKSVVLEDDDDFDAFYASVHSTPITKIKVYFGDDQLPTTSTTGHDAAFTGGPTQSLESQTVHHTAADGHNSSPKRKVTFVEPISEPLRDDVERPKKIQRTVVLDESGQPPPNSEAPPETPVTIDVVSAGVEEAHETHDDAKKKTRNKKGDKKKGKAVDPTLEVQSSDMAVLEASGSNSKESTTKAKDHVNVSGNTPYDATKSKKRPRTSATDDIVQPVTEMLVGTAALGIDDTEGYPRSSKKLRHTHQNSEVVENAATDLTGDNQADTRTKDPEGPEHHTPSNGEADPSEVGVLTQLPRETKKSRKPKEVVEVVINKSNAASSASKSKGRTSNNETAVQRAKKSDSQPAVPISELETNSKGKTKIPGPNKSLSTHTKPTLNETQSEKETVSSASAGGKTTKKSRKKEATVEPPEADGVQDQALSSDVMAATRAAVNAILARSSLPGKGSKKTLTHAPLADVITSSLSTTPIVPVTSTPPPDDQPNLPNNVSTTAEPPKMTPKCPICNQTPYHARSRCPIIKSGIRAMRRRIVELQRDASEGNDEEREKVIEELRRIIDKRSRCKPPAAENKSTNVKFTADKPVHSPTLVAGSSGAIQSPRTSEAAEPVRAPSQELMPLPSLAESLAVGDVSSYTVQELEDLIRGPNVTLADVPSSDSSEEEEEVLEEEPEEAPVKSSRSRGRIQYPSSSEEEEEEEEEASPFVSSIIPLPIKSASEPSNEDESFHSEDFQGDTTSFHEVNGLGSSLEVDETGDAAVNAAYALDIAHLSVPEISANGREVVTDGHILNALDESQAREECESETDVVKPPAIATPQSDPIEASDKPESPQSPIVSIEEDIHPLQSTPKIEVGTRTRSQRNNSALVQKNADPTSKPNNTGVNGINNNSRSAKKTGGLIRITDLPIPDNPAIRVIKPAGLQTRRQAARTEDGEAKADEQGPSNESQVKQTNGKLSFKTSANMTKTPAKIAKTPAKKSSRAPVLSNGENPKTQSVTAVQDVHVLETMASASSNEEQSLASWAVLQGDSQLEAETPGMVDELHSSPSIRSSQKPTSPAAVNGVFKELDPLFLGSDSQQSFPFSQYTGFNQEPAGSEDEEDEVEASVVKPRTATKSSSKFRSLTEIASQPTLSFTPTLRLAQTASTKDEGKNIYGRASKDSEEESDDSDSDSDSDAEERMQSSHIPKSRRAGVSLSYSS